MGKFFSNVWTKRAVSILSPFYCVPFVYLSYLSVFYEMSMIKPVTICVLLSAIGVFALVTMLYSRKQILTIVSSLVMLPALLPAVLLYFGQWHVLIPLLVVALVIFFFSGLGETAKTVYGTIFVLLYLLGSLVYFLMTTLFAPSTVSKVIEEGVSPSGDYRYEVINTVDSSDGSTKVVVEPNTMDKDMDMLYFSIRGMERTVFLARPQQQVTKIEWKSEKRTDITNKINSISRDVEVTLSDAQMELLGLPAYEVTYTGSSPMKMMPADYHAVEITLTAEQMKKLETDKEVYMLDSLSENALKKLGITVENLKTVKLTSLKDADLVKLGIPDHGDVMYCNGKPVFRYYIAVLEEYFDISKQEIDLT